MIDPADVPDRSDIHSADSSSIRSSDEQLLQELSDEELVGLCSGGDFWHTKAVKRLGIEALLLTDGPHGLRKQTGAADNVGLGESEPATCFPTASALASSWDPQLMHAVGSALADEALAAEVAVVLGPGLNIKRSPLCGRGFEYFSEDPYLSGKLAAGLIRGLEERGVASCPKHFAVNSQETRRMVLDEVVDERALREIYLRGFEIAIGEGRPSTVMCAYNRVNGEYCSESRFLLTDVLRQEWGFSGLVVSDWGAVNDRLLGLRAGLDLEMPSSGGVNDTKLLAAIKDGRLNRKSVEVSVRRLLDLHRRKRGARGPAAKRADMGEREALHDHNHLLARRAAAESLVLLKNDGATLPLRPSTRKTGLGGPQPVRLAIVGAFAKDPRYQGSGSSRVNPTRLESLVEALEAEEAAGQITLSYAPGYERTEQGASAEAAMVRAAGEKTASAAAVEAARDADVAVVCVGLTEEYESEGFDRSTLDLPPSHNALVHAVAAANPNVIVILQNGAPVLMPWINEVPAVIEAYLGGQAGGPAIVDVLFGRTNPSGKLAETFPAALQDTPCAEMYPERGAAAVHGESVFVGYRYYHTAGVPVLFPFGHGLSYARFEYQNAVVVDGNTSAPILPAAVRVTIANTGDVDGAEVIQVYVRPRDNEVIMPERALAGFRKVTLSPGSSVEVEVVLDDRAFLLWNGARWAVEPGRYELLVGSSSADIRLIREVLVGPGGSNGAAGDGAAAPARSTVAGPHIGGLRRRYLCADLPGYSVADKAAFIDDSPDGERARIFGERIAAARRRRRPKYSLTSTLLEVSGTRVGQKLYEAAHEGATKTLAPDAAESERRLMQAMVDEMPLRNMITMSNGDLSEETVLALIHLMNRHPIRGLLGLLRAGRADRQKKNRRESP